MKVPWILMPSFLQSALKRRAKSVRTPFLMFTRIWSSPDSKPTSSRRRPFSFMIFSDLYGTFAFALHDHVMPSLPRPIAIASARGRSSVKVSSSNISSFTSGMLSRIHFASASTFSTERVR